MLPRAIVLAGGKSSRFGSNKANADIGGQSLTALCVQGVLEVFEQVIVVSKRPEELGLLPDRRIRLIKDSQPTHAAMIGLFEGLSRSDRMLNYIVGCDMPIAVPAIIEQLHRSVRGLDCAVRCDSDGRPQPLGAFYSKRCLPVVSRMIEAQDYRLVTLIGELDAALMPYEQASKLDPEFESFVNVNMPSDIEPVIEKRTRLTIGAGPLKSDMSKQRH